MGGSTAVENAILVRYISSLAISTQLVTPYNRLLSISYVPIPLLEVEVDRLRASLTRFRSVRDRLFSLPDCTTTTLFRRDSVLAVPLRILPDMSHGTGRTRRTH